VNQACRGKFPSGKSSEDVYGRNNKLVEGKERKTKEETNRSLTDGKRKAGSEQSSPDKKGGNLVSGGGRGGAKVNQRRREKKKLIIRGGLGNERRSVKKEVLQRDQVETTSKNGGNGLLIKIKCLKGKKEIDLPTNHFKTQGENPRRERGRRTKPTRRVYIEVRTQGVSDQNHGKENVKKRSSRTYYFPLLHGNKKKGVAIFHYTEIKKSSKDEV